MYNYVYCMISNELSVYMYVNKVYCMTSDEPLSLPLSLSVSVYIYKMLDEVNDNQVYCSHHERHIEHIFWFSRVSALADHVLPLTVLCCVKTHCPAPVWFTHCVGHSWMDS